MRKYNIHKYPNNTHYTVTVTDSYGQEHRAFFRTTEECDKYVYEVWENEVDNSDEAMESLANAVFGCIKLDKKLGLLKGNRDNLD
jgi:hypothetical protein